MKTVNSVDSRVLSVFEAIAAILAEQKKIRKQIFVMGGGQQLIGKLEKKFGTDPRQWPPFDESHDYRVVYAIECADFVKIGLSIDGNDRLQQLQTGCPIRLKLLGQLPGSKRLEKSLHAYLADSNQHYEWFLKTERVMQVVEGIATGELEQFVTFLA